MGVARAGEGVFWLSPHVLRESLIQDHFISVTLECIRSASPSVQATALDIVSSKSPRVALHASGFKHGATRQSIAQWAGGH